MKTKKAARSVYAGLRDTITDINAVAEKIPEAEIKTLVRDLKTHWSDIKRSLKSSGSKAKKSGGKRSHKHTKRAAA
jgi:hypothetical protein